MKMMCLCCPISCDMDVVKEKRGISVNGNKCPRGVQYAREELVAPKRTFTGVFKNKYGVFSVKTTTTILKKDILKLAEEIKRIPEKNYAVGDIVMKDIFKQKANLLVTGKTVI